MSTGNFGRYLIREEKGRGGMATVYHAYDPLFERDIAIKVLPREFLHDPQFRTRFEREAKMVASLEHPAIVPVYDFGEEDGQPYIVMRYMSGGSLSDRIEKGPMSLEEVVKTITRLAPALDAAHAKGIIHRDIKPGNILYDQYDNAFLSDFGIARVIQTTPATLTGGAILGTPAYMSPEQVQGGDLIDGRSDIYSLGVIIYQMLTGKTPYQADSFASLMMMHILEPVPHILDAKADLPVVLDSIISKAMAKQPHERYQSTHALAEALQNVVGSDVASGKQPVSSPSSTLIIEPEPDEVPAHPEKVKAPSHPTPTPTPSAPSPAAPSAKPVYTGSRSLPLGIQIITTILIVAIGILSVVAFLDARRAARQVARETQPQVAAVLTSTATLQASDTPTPSPSATPLPTDTPTPTHTPLPPTATPTNTPVPAPLVLGGADMIAFIRGSDVWTVKLDGSELAQITTDGGSKRQLQWTPDGKALVYISGLCVKIVYLPQGRVDEVVCFEYAGTQINEFEISPDGSHAAISVNQELYIVPFDLEKLKEVDRPSKVKVLSDCPAMAPYSSSTGSAYSVSAVRWSQDAKSLAILQKVVFHGIQEDAVLLTDISDCEGGHYLLDEFPGDRFRIEQVTNLHNVAWDGFFNFAMVKIIRNEGFGDMYFYNSDLHKPDSNRNPLGGNCCYREPSYSPSGSYLLFAFQDIRMGNITELYYIPVGTLFTGLSYKPIPLPEGFFEDPKENPQPVARPAIILP